MAHRSEFVIVRDTREQRGYEFNGYEVIDATLKTGDYSVLGYEHRIAIERKSKEDAWGCVGSGRARFEACLVRLGALERAAIVIECNLAQFANPPKHVERVDPRMAVGSYISWSCVHRIPIFWCDSRPYAERVVIRFLAAYLKHVANGHDHRASPATRAHPSATGLSQAPTL